METIKIYLENVFKALPQTEEVLRIKNELLGDMEAKYEDFRAAGKSEHEATAVTIGEFGNIDELLIELGIDLRRLDAQKTDDCMTDIPKTDSQDRDTKISQRIIHRVEVAEFLFASGKASLLIAIGVALILFGVSVLTGLVCFVDLLGGDDDLAASLSVILLLLLIIPAVGLFIYAGFRMEKYKHIESGEFEIDVTVQQELKKEYEEHKSKYFIGIVAGVGLIMLAVVVMMAINTFVPTYDSLSVSLLLWMIAIAVFILIRTGMADSAYKKLLGLGDFSPSARSRDKVIGAVAAFVWPMVTCIFLIWGLVFDGFHIAWIVFPVTGILFGGFAALYSMLKGGK